MRFYFKHIRVHMGKVFTFTLLLSNKICQKHFRLNIMQLNQKLMSQCHILSDHFILTSSNIRFLKAIHLVICFHKHKVRDHHKIQTQTAYRE